eukprot:CAMPEP_0205825206 /NCGR_PEP_ID=MMETSP0206-20130828/24320_1 /ASSEMBLY_ACC=CAM_ASM_000279 /TAXON_ID=36767 /ORGANISM="Euplotes focardii, Strain TN1" /LENGTH=175 /DNA_ID=CAMNT_0053124055 /DNA_START=17 /DNA_END=541 /DNA_ORIENTATION=+
MSLSSRNAALGPGSVDDQYRSSLTHGGSEMMKEVNLGKYHGLILQPPYGAVWTSLHVLKVFAWLALGSWFCHLALSNAGAVCDAHILTFLRLACLLIWAVYGCQLLWLIEERCPQCADQLCLMVQLFITGIGSVILLGWGITGTMWVFQSSPETCDAYLWGHAQKSMYAMWVLFG